MTTSPVHSSPRQSAAVRLAAATLALGALCVVAGCGTATPTRYYTVEGSAPAVPSALAYRAPPVHVRELRVPAAMNRPELVNGRAGGAVQLREFDLWAAPLERNARQALTQSLAARLPAGSVVFAGAARPAERIDLNVEVLSLRIADGDAAMWVAWGAQRLPPPAGAAGAAPAPPAVRELRLRTPAGDDAAGTAKAWSALLGQLADRIAAELTAAP